MTPSRFFLLLAAVSVLLSPAYAHAAEPASGLQVQKTEQSLNIQKSDGTVVVGYQLVPDSFEKLTVESGCFFHPLTTPQGVVVTDVAPEDHPHHRGVFLGFVELHARQSADFWGWGEHAPTGGRKVVNRELTEKPDQSAGFEAKNAWMIEDQLLMHEQLTAEVQQNEKATILDLTYRLLPTENIKLAQWAFSGFCVRVPKEGDLTAYSPQGKVDLANPSHLKPSTDWPAERWYAYELKLPDEKIVTVAVIDHPKNLPALWHNHRDVRMLNPSIVAPEQLEWKKDQVVELRYRVVAQDGSLSAETLDQLAEEFRQ